MVDMRTEKKGFSLVELVVVIAILGILAAFAIPRFISLEPSARASVANGVSGAVSSASSLIHALAVANNQTGSTGSVTANGQAVALVHGYPNASATGIGSSFILSGDVPPTYGAATAGASATFAVDGASGKCTITYTSPAASGNAGTVTVDDSGC